MVRTAGLAALGAMVVAAPCSATVQMHSKATIETSEGSKSYNVPMTFAVGQELNTATQSFKYDAFKLYGVIFWTNGGASVIKFDNFNLCSGEADEGCVKNTIGKLHGPDQEGRVWTVCPGESACF